MKQSTRVLIGLGLSILAGVLFVMKDSPRIDALSAFGGFLGQNSCLCLQSGQEGGEILAELMGGGQYLGNLEEEGEQEKVMAVLENSQTRQNKEIEPDASQPMIGDVETGQSQAVVSNNQSQVLRQKNALVEQLRESKDVDFLWKNFYIVDSTTSVTKKQFDVNKLLSQNMKLKKKEGKKQILIYHTHGASETFQNSRKNVVEDTVVGVGTELAKELEKRGYSVYHDTKQYDRINGKIDRSLAYNESLAGIQKIRSENPECP